MIEQHKNCLECGGPLKKAKSSTGDVYYLCGTKECKYYGMKVGKGLLQYIGNMELIQE